MSYFSTLHRQPVEHKKRFALFVSSAVTIFIFGIWSLVKFGGGGEVVAQDKNTNENSPFESFTSNMASSFQALKDSFKELNSRSSTIYGE
jgi:hypothetical protein